MKKFFTLSILLSFCIVAAAQSSIVFNSTDAPVAPWKQVIRKDTLPLPAINFGSKGANQTYDFSNLVYVLQDTINYYTPNATQLTNVPGCDDAITTDSITFLFTKTTSAKYSLLGFQGVISGSVLSAAYSTAPDLYHFPTQYNGNYSGSYYLQKTVPGSQVGQPGVNAVRLTINGNYTDTVDGWGKAITPIGAYKCLRIKRKDTQTTLIEAQLISGFPFSTVSTKTATTTHYTYPTKETKGSVVSFDYDSLDNVTGVSYSLIPPNAPVANFGFTIGNGGSVAFTDSSDNYPTSWAWTFGDGGTSTQQNPNHTYTANDTYTVCLIATNAGGSSAQVCKQVVINNIAVTPVANFSWVNPSGGLVNFTDLSTNTPTSWAWTFGDGGNSTAQNPNHVYAANNTYNVCLTATNIAGSNQICKNVVVTGITAANNSPVATNDTASVLQPNSEIINVAANDVDPDGNPLCITSIYGNTAYFTILNCDSILYHPDSTFVGTDSVYYIICDNGTPQLCDTAKLLVSSNFNSALLPSASFTNSIFYYEFCFGYTFKNTSIQYDSVIWNFHPLNTTADSFYNNVDSVRYYGNVSNHDTIQVCLTAINSFGSSSVCDTVHIFCQEGISEAILSDISIYPNPASNLLTINMRNSNDVAVSNYSAVELYNILGEKVKAIAGDRNKKLVSISVSDLPQGIYVATLTDAKGVRKTLGRFTKE
jgi:PKD repeat protein